MRRRILLLLALTCFPFAFVSLVAAGCGPSVTAIGADDEDGGADAKNDVKYDGSWLKDSGKDALDEVFDPPCPDIPPITDFQCDPYNQFNGDCFPGEGCYIYVDYPSEPCAQEVYGAFCMPVGPGQQGDQCFGGQDCGAGFVCVVTGSGTQCVQLCPLSGNDNCPPGLVCEPIDVEGFGGCL